MLSGYDREGFENILNSSVVAVTFDDAAAGSSEGRITLELAVNLLSRLYPRLAVVPSSRMAEGFANELVSLARSINPKTDIESSLEETDVCLAVQSTPATVTVPVVYLGSDGWVARVSTKGPQGSGPTENPFGAAPPPVLAPRTPSAPSSPHSCPKATSTKICPCPCWTTNPPWQSLSTPSYRSWT